MSNLYGLSPDPIRGSGPSHPAEIPRPSSFLALRRRLSTIGLSLLLAVVVVCVGIKPALADAGRFLAGSDYAELRSELASLESTDPANPKASLSSAQQQRLKDLQQIERQIARSDDRAQLRNRSTHNLGLFARSKKIPADQDPTFYVLAPGHSTDDDFDLVALLIPSGVSLSWGEAGEAAAISTGSRVVRVLEGQQVIVSDPPAPAGQIAATATQGAAPLVAAGLRSNGNATEAAPSSYRLSQPPFQVLSRWDPLPELPELSQAGLDQERETAPLD